MIFAAIVPYETFEASDGWISHGVANDELWKRFCKAADRVRSRDILVPIVKDIIKQRKRDDWQPLMEAAGIPSGGVRTVGEVCDGALLKSRDMIAEVRHTGKGVGGVKTIKNPMHLSDTPLSPTPPRLGEPTHEILTGLLAYSASEVEELARSETI
jgi:crotonobetainyl-CoA:carnitine CoA-transferase CaiB-like acyl-CoA transferase